MSIHDAQITVATNQFVARIEDLAITLSGTSPNASPGRCRKLVRPTACSSIRPTGRTATCGRARPTTLLARGAVSRARRALKQEGQLSQLGFDIVMARIARVGGPHR